MISKQGIKEFFMFRYRYYRFHRYKSSSRSRRFRGGNFKRFYNYRQGNYERDLRNSISRLRFQYESTLHYYSGFKGFFRSFCMSRSDVYRFRRLRSNLMRQRRALDYIEYRKQERKARKEHRRYLSSIKRSDFGF
jgi:hypothetical protein